MYKKNKTKNLLDSIYILSADWLTYSKSSDASASKNVTSKCLSNIMEILIWCNEENKLSFLLPKEKCLSLFIIGLGY